MKVWLIIANDSVEAAAQGSEAFARSLKNKMASEDAEVWIKEQRLGPEAYKRRFQWRIREVPLYTEPQTQATSPT